MVIHMFSHHKQAVMIMDLLVEHGIGIYFGKEFHSLNVKRFVTEILTLLLYILRLVKHKQQILIDLLLWLAVFLLFLESFSLNLAFTMKDLTFGVVRISNFLTKFGCAMVKCYLFPAPELVTCIV